MKMKIRKLTDEAVMPKYAHSDDAAMDLTATSVNIVDKGSFGYREYGTGLAIDIPKGFAGLIFPRSSISETGLILSNSVGVVDPGYHGEIKARFKEIPDSHTYGVGDRVAQLMVIPVDRVEWEQVDDLGTSERGEKGFGSTN